MLSENAVRVCVTLWLEAGCKSIGGGIYHIPHCLVCEGYRICQLAVIIPRSLVYRMPAMHSIIGSFDQIVNSK